MEHSNCVHWHGAYVIQGGTPTNWNFIQRTISLDMTTLHGKTFPMSAKCYYRRKLVYRTLCNSWVGHGLMCKKSEKKITWSPHPLPNDGMHVDTLDQLVLFLAHRFVTWYDIWFCFQPCWKGIVGSWPLVHVLGTIFNSWHHVQIQVIFLFFFINTTLSFSPNPYLGLWVAWWGAYSFTNGKHHLIQATTTTTTKKS